MTAFLLHPLTISVIKLLFVITCVLTTVAWATWLERRTAGTIQLRKGPNRVGPFGLFQPIADGIKNFFKEDIIPSAANPVLYIIAPALILIPALMTFAVIPFGENIEIAGKTITFQLTDINVGLLYILAMSGLGVYGLVIGGWASNNKYSLLGGLRAAAQMISYELPLGLGLLAVFMVTGTFRLRGIVQTAVDTGWWLYTLILAPTIIIFGITSFAEANRLPFDMPECESELVGGYHTEYSSMKFALYFMAEYVHMVTLSSLMTVLFLGGWYLPWITEWAANLNPQTWYMSIIVGLIPFGIFAAKVWGCLFVFIWVRWTLPRFRYDQVMRLGWKYLLPVAIVNIFFVAVMVELFLGRV